MKKKKGFSSKQLIQSVKEMSKSIDGVLTQTVQIPMVVTNAVSLNMFVHNGKVYMTVPLDRFKVVRR